MDSEEEGWRVYWTAHVFLADRSVKKSIREFMPIVLQEECKLI